MRYARAAKRMHLAKLAAAGLFAAAAAFGGIGVGVPGFATAEPNNDLAWDIEAYENCVKKINLNWSWEAQRDAMEVCCLKSGGQWVYNEMGNGAGKCVAPPPGVPAGRRVSVPAGLENAPTVTPAPLRPVPPGLLDLDAASVTPTSPQVE